MHQYTIRKANELAAPEIGQILQYWEVSEWAGMDEDTFRHAFRDSEFHLLTDERSTLLALARINFDFCLEIAGVRYRFAEFVGFVAAEKRKGYGSELLSAITGNLRSRRIETIGFCESEVRGFYQKCRIYILYDQAKHLREFDQNQWIVPTDDDILDLTLSEESRRLFAALDDRNLAYLVS